MCFFTVMRFQCNCSRCVFNCSNLQEALHEFIAGAEWQLYAVIDTTKRERKVVTATTENTSKSLTAVFRWQIPSLNKAGVVVLSVCQTSKACKQGTVSLSMLSDAVISPWHGATLQIEDAVAELFLSFQIQLLYSGHVHCVTQKGGVVCGQKNC